MDSSSVPSAIEGIITRRRCLGRHLAFCDVSVAVENKKSDNHEERTEVGVSKAAAAEKTVPVVFRRYCFNEQMSDAFPVKNSSLPYGARVSMTIRPSQQPPSASKVQNNSESGPSSLMEVLQWTITETHPHDKAIEIASRPGGGVSCTDYLRVRREAFVNVIAGADGRLAVENGRGPAEHPSLPTLKARPLLKSGEYTKTSSSNSILEEYEESNPHYGHGKAKALRAKIFSEWLCKFLLECDGSDAVLDIAGGKGQLSMELAATSNIPCTVIDPLVRRKPNMKRLRKSGAPLPEFVARSFVNDNIQEQEPQSDSQNGGLGVNIASLIQAHTCLVGLHPDQVTEDILDAALRFNKSIAIVPCCVFPSFFPMRALRSGQAVNSYEQFLLYLSEKDPRLRRTTLPFDGKNEVLYLKVNRE